MEDINSLSKQLSSRMTIAIGLLVAILIMLITLTVTILTRPSDSGSLGQNNTSTISSSSASSTEDVAVADYSDTLESFAVPEGANLSGFDGNIIANGSTTNITHNQYGAVAVFQVSEPNVKIEDCRMEWLLRNDKKVTSIFTPYDTNSPITSTSVQAGFYNSSGSGIGTRVGFPNTISTGQARSTHYIGGDFKNYGGKLSLTNKSGASSMIIGVLFRISNSLRSGDEFEPRKFECNVTDQNGNQIPDIVYNFGSGEMLYRVTSNPGSSSSTTSANGGDPRQVTIHRYYAESLGTHFYTPNVNAMKKFTEYKHEGPIYIAFVDNPNNDPNLVPIHQFYNSRTRAHLWTASESQKNRIINNPTLQDFNYEGHKYFAYKPGSNVSGSVENHRFYNNGTAAHFFTAKPNEYSAMRTKFKDSFSYEGVAFNVLPTE